MSKRGEARLPVPHRLVGEDEAPLQEHLGQVAQAQLVVQAPEHHQQHDVGGVLQEVEGGAGPLLKAASALLSIADAAGGWAGKAGNALDTTNRVLTQFAQDHSARPTLDSWGNALFGGLSVAAPAQAGAHHRRPRSAPWPTTTRGRCCPARPAPRSSGRRPRPRRSRASPGALMLRGLATGAIGTPVTSITGLDAARGGVTAAAEQPPRARDAAHTASLDALDARLGTGGKQHIAVTDAEQRLQLAMYQKAPQGTITSALGIVLQAIKEDTSMNGVQKSLLSGQERDLVAGFGGAKNPTNVLPFAQNNAGLGGLEAGFGGTAVRFGGGRDPQTEEIRKLKEELHQANDRIATLLEQVVTNTGRGGQAASAHPLLAIGGSPQPQGQMRGTGMDAMEAEDRVERAQEALIAWLEADSPRIEAQIRRIVAEAFADADVTDQGRAELIDAVAGLLASWQAVGAMHARLQGDLWQHERATARVAEAEAATAAMCGTGYQQ